MSKFTESSTPEVEDIQKVEISGTFLCQTCDEPVYTAFYLPEAKLLAWRCEQRHKSFVEKFVL